MRRREIDLEIYTNKIAERGRRLIRLLEFLIVRSRPDVPVDFPVCGVRRREIDLEIYTNKIAESGRRLIGKAYEEARGRDHNQIAPEHLFVSIAEAERPFFNEVMQSLNVDPYVVIQGLETELQSLETKLDQRDYLSGIKISKPLRTLLQNALMHSREQGRRLIESTDLFYALFTDTHNYPVRLLRRLGADHEMVMQKIAARVRSHGEKTYTDKPVFGTSHEQRR